MTSSGDKDVDKHFMQQAFSLSLRGRLTTAPNPWVGAVIVGADGTVLGSGFHSGPGCPHAEVEAVKDAEAHGHTDFSTATIYTTLEPCHWRPGKRTPGCDALVVAKRFQRCVIGHLDPDRTFGGGVDVMKEGGVAVCCVCDDAVRDSLRPYFHHRRTGWPYVVIKIATSLDGRVGCADGTSQWITQSAAREDAHRLRATSQAILVGSGTALKDAPSLTVRLPEGCPRQPLRVVLDSCGRVVSGSLMDTSMAPTLVFTSDRCDPNSQLLWTARGVEYLVIPEAGSGLDLRAVLDHLATRGVLQLMVEGGAVVQAAFLQAGLCEEMRVYLGATLLGSSAQPWAKTELTTTIADAQFWRLQDMRRLGNDVCLEYQRAA